uniref:Cadherin domain-containing protein n=1 Tax=Pundamilia nyererei TaxID=303518 RepID=A0A3B4EY46_9CICH
MGYSVYALHCGLAYMYIIFGTVSGDVSYSMPEEIKRGSIIGNIAKDLGLDLGRLSTRKPRIDTEDSGYCSVNLNTGELIVQERIDREGLCAKKASCVLKQELVLENPLELHRIHIRVQDINDNSPQFKEESLNFEIHELADKGTGFPLDEAHDADIGENAVQGYSLQQNDHFRLNVKSKGGGRKYGELVLDKELDREDKKEIALLLTAFDGGSPQRSGTVVIHVTVLDANDNVPVFSQNVYKASLHENSPLDTVVLTVSATDADEGVNGEVNYGFDHVSEERQDFSLDPKTGAVRVAGAIDYEKESSYEIQITAKDGLGLASHCKLIIDVIDVNDNKPVIEIKSASSNVAEDSKPGTMVALINIYDMDTGSSGRVTCTISKNVPFKLVSEVKNYYMLVTDGILDREVQPEYNLTVTATDAGSPPLTSVKVIPIAISDINDNPPTFMQSEYNANILENQPVGTFVIKVKAEDVDDGSNAKIQYQISKDTNSEVSSFLSINSDTGEVFTSRMFDYEQSVYFQIKVTARDGGGPSLSTTCIINVFIKDQNDNAPVVLYPVQSSGYIAEDMVPAEAPRGYLVTKVVAVDADSGHNAWLSYRIIKATRPNVFMVDLHTGEIRTTRTFIEDDEPKHTIVVLVTDNGLESLSATATVSIMLGDGLPVLSELLEFADESQESDNLTLYLIIALSTVSSMFILLISGVFYFKLCRRGYVYRSTTASLPVFPTTYCPSSFADFSRCGTLLNDERYDSFMTTGSWRGDFRFASNTDTDTLKKRSAAYQKNTLRRLSADRATLKKKNILWLIPFILSEQVTDTT